MPPGPLRPRHGLVPPASQPPSPTTVRSADRLQALLTDLGPDLRRGNALPSPRAEAPDPLRPSGLQAIDELIGGGFPADRLSEITGPASSGRTSVALALLARTTRKSGELAAVVDLADAFDPVSAEAAGVDLDRVLWVRVGGLREALRCVERLLETEGLPVVILDSSAPSPASARPATRRRPHRARSTGPALSASTWTRLARSSVGTRTTLMVLSDQRLTGSQAELVLEMRPPRPRFTGTPPLLEEIGLRAVLVRRRGAPLPSQATDEDPTETKRLIGSG